MFSDLTSCIPLEAGILSLGLLFRSEPDSLFLSKDVERPSLDLLFADFFSFDGFLLFVGCGDFDNCGDVECRVDFSNCFASWLDCLFVDKINLVRGLGARFERSTLCDSVDKMNLERGDGDRFETPPALAQF